MKDHQQLVRDLLERGLAIERGKHLKVVDDAGQVRVVLGTSSAHARGDKNAVAALRRHGLISRPENAPSHPKRGRRPESHVVPYSGPGRPFGRAPRREVLGDG